jgi:hypothetical protein
VNGKQISLLVGADGQVLEADSSTASGLGWKQGIRKLITTAGDLIYGTAAGVAQRLGIGTEGQVLTVSAGGLPVWQAPAVGAGGGGGGSAADIIDNGVMDVWQRGNAAKTNTGDGWLADRWKFLWSTGTMNFTSLRSTNVPSFADAGLLLNYSSEIKCDTTEAGFAAAEYAVIRHTVEGFRWRTFAQRQWTLSFWVYSTKTGIYCASVRNGGLDRSYVAEFTVNVSNTWEQKVIVIPASPSAGTWNYLTDAGIHLSICLGAGANYFTAANAWQTGNFLSTSNQVNFFDNTSNYFRLTGVKAELGNAATLLTPLPFPEEVLRCKRYYQKSFPYDETPRVNSFTGVAPYQCLATRNGAVQQGGQRFSWQVPMRTIPLRTFYNPYQLNNNARDIGAGVDCAIADARDEQGNVIYFQGHASTVIGNQIVVHWSVDADWA